MDNKKLKKTFKVLLIALPAAAVAGLWLYIKIADSAIPSYSDQDMKDAKYQYSKVESRANEVFHNVLKDAEKQAREHPDYQKLQKQIGKYCNALDDDNLIGKPNANIVKQHKQMLIVKDSLIEEYLQQSAELKEAQEQLKYHESRIKTLERNKVIKDSLLNIPITERFRSNVLQYKKAFHQARIEHHKQRLNQLSR